MPSVAFRVKTISRSLAALKKRRTFVRAPSYAVVASSLRLCTPRCTFELMSV